MKKLRVGELAKLYGINRQSVYKRINKGELSKSSDGLIDFAEALRVFGEPSDRGVDVTQEQSQVTVNDTESYTLKIQLDMFEKQIKKLEENESFLKEQIKEKDNSIHLLQTLLSAPKQTQADTNIKVEDTIEKTSNENPAPLPPQTVLYADKEQTNHDQKPRKKGLLGRVFNAVFE